MEETSLDPPPGSWIDCIQQEMFHASQQKLTIDAARHSKGASLHSNTERVAAATVPYLHTAHRDDRRHLRSVCEAGRRLLREPIELPVYTDKSESTTKVCTLQGDPGKENTMPHARPESKRIEAKRGTACSKGRLGEPIELPVYKDGSEKTTIAGTLQKGNSRKKSGASRARLESETTASSLGTQHAKAEPTQRADKSSKETKGVQCSLQENGLHVSMRKNDASAPAAKQSLPPLIGRRISQTTDQTTQVDTRGAQLTAGNENRETDPEKPRYKVIMGSVPALGGDRRLQTAEPLPQVDESPTTEEEPTADDGGVEAGLDTPLYKVMTVSSPRRVRSQNLTVVNANANEAPSVDASTAVEASERRVIPSNSGTEAHDRLPRPRLEASSRGAWPPKLKNAAKGAGIARNPVARPRLKAWGSESDDRRPQKSHSRNANAWAKTQTQIGQPRPEEDAGVPREVRVDVANTCPADSRDIVWPSVDDETADGVHGDDIPAPRRDRDEGATAPRCPRDGAATAARARRDVARGGEGRPRDGAGGGGRGDAAAARVDALQRELADIRRLLEDAASKWIRRPPEEID